jgi:hypothetical protein
MDTELCNLSLSDMLLSYINMHIKSDNMKLQAMRSTTVFPLFGDVDHSIVPELFEGGAEILR